MLLIAWREIHERLRSRAFLVSTALMLLIVGGSTALNGALSKQPTYRYAVTAPAPAALDAALRRAAKPFDAKTRLRTVDSVAAGRQLLTDQKADALLLLGRNRVVFRANVDAKIAAVADSAVRAVRHRLPPTPELTAATVEPPDAKATDAATAVAYVGSLLLLLSVTVYGQWVLTGVVEEKANRVVELVVSAVRPRDLMAGKVIGIGVLGLAQVALVGGLASILLALGVFDTPASLGASLALVIPWFALGFALYAVAYATVGALASRAQDANSAGQPVTYTILAGYFIGYAAVASDMNGLLANVLTVFPVTAPLVLPARSALTGVPLWEHAVAVLLMVASIVLLIRVAGRVYAHGLLRGGPRIGLRAAWRASRADA